MCNKDELLTFEPMRSGREWYDKGWKDSMDARGFVPREELEDVSIKWQEIKKDSSLEQYPNDFETAYRQVLTENEADVGYSAMDRDKELRGRDNLSWMKS